MVCLQAGLEYYLTKTLKTMTKVLLASVVIMGGLTLAFRDETFILWKPTIINWVLAGSWQAVNSCLANPFCAVS